MIHSIGRETDRDEDAESDASHPGEEEVGSSFVESLASFGSASPPGEGQSGEGDGGAGQALEIDSLVRRSSRDHLLHFRPFHRETEFFPPLHQLERMKTWEHRNPRPVDA